MQPANVIAMPADFPSSGTVNRFRAAFEAFSSKAEDPTNLRMSPSSNSTRKGFSMKSASSPISKKETLAATTFKSQQMNEYSAKHVKSPSAKNGEDMPSLEQKASAVVKPVSEKSIVANISHDEFVVEEFVEDLISKAVVLFHKEEELLTFEGPSKVLQITVSQAEEAPLASHPENECDKTSETEDSTDTLSVPELDCSPLKAAMTMPQGTPEEQPTNEQLPQVQIAESAKDNGQEIQGNRRNTSNEIVRVSVKKLLQNFSGSKSSKSSQDNSQQSKTNDMGGHIRTRSNVSRLMQRFKQSSQSKPQTAAGESPKSGKKWQVRMMRSIRLR